jgi:hypothetical protein
MITLSIKELPYYPVTEWGTLRRQQALFVAIYIVIAILNTITLVLKETPLFSLSMFP